MTDETYEKIRDWIRENAVPELGPLGELPVFVDVEVPIDEPVFSAPPWAIALKLHPYDYSDLKRRVEGGRDVH